jgi:hypothetical protein
MKFTEITQTKKECYITINHEAMKELARQGKAEDLGENIKNTNKYIGIVGNNTCLVGVGQDEENGIYCSIDKTIEREDGEQINQVEQLKPFSFYADFISKTRVNTRTSSSKLTRELGYEKRKIDISEIIHTLRTGKITGKVTGLEIHHKLNVFDHRIDCCEQITHEEHKTRSSKSHKGGLIAENYEQLVALIEKLEADRKYCATL